jgi:hypothetical protein
MVLASSNESAPLTVVAFVAFDLRVSRRSGSQPRLVQSMVILDSSIHLLGFEAVSFFSNKRLTLLFNPSMLCSAVLPFSFSSLRMRTKAAPAPIARA